jgi:DNA-binding PadR family transcriptional regulator
VSLRFAILTALTERESTGLELSRRFDRSIGYFWPASHQQIYRELDRLTADVADQPDQQRPGRGQPKRYAISPDGVAALREWVGELDEPTKRREALFVRLRASASLGETGAVRGAIEHHLALHRANLVTYREIEARDFDPPADKRAALQHLVLQAGIELELAHVCWCEHALEELDRWDDADDA